jgi:hypothetical protein
MGVAMTPKEMKKLGVVSNKPGTWYIPHGFVAGVRRGKLWIEPAKKDYPAQFLRSRQGSIELLTVTPPWTDFRHAFDSVIITRYFDASSFSPHGLPLKKRAR